MAGYNTEYSGLKFGMFYVGEFLHTFTAATLFLGGYNGPFVDQFPLNGIVYLFAKTFVIYFVTILFRGSLPRLRLDQMLKLCWKVLTPLSVAIVFITALVDKAVVELGGGTLGIRTIVLFAVNLLILYLVLSLLEKHNRPTHRVVSKERPVATYHRYVSNPLHHQTFLLNCFF